MPFHLAAECSGLIGFQPEHFDLSAAVQLIEDAREETKSILADAHTNTNESSAVNTQISRSLWVYLSFEPRWYSSTAERQKSPTQMLVTLLKKLFKFVDRAWYYENIIYTNIQNATRDLTDIIRNSEAVHIRFFADPKNDNFAAATGTDVKGQLIMINLSSFDTPYGQKLLRDILLDLEPNDNLDDLFTSITPMLLHECIHSVDSRCNDIALDRNEMPTWFDTGRREVQDYEHMTHIPCYSDYMCRALSKLARMRYRLQEAICEPFEMIEKRRAPFRNVENINRALVSIWLAGERKDLEFASVAIDAASKIRRTSERSSRLVDMEKRESHMPVNLYDLRDVRGPSGLTGYITE